jgi:hypothetical protein
MGSSSARKRMPTCGYIFATAYLANWEFLFEYASGSAETKGV